MKAFFRVLLYRQATYTHAQLKPMVRFEPWPTPTSDNKAMPPKEKEKQINEIRIPKNPLIGVSSLYSERAISGQRNGGSHLVRFEKPSLPSSLSRTRDCTERQTKSRLR